MSDDLWAMAPVTPPHTKAGVMHKECSCGDCHEAENTIEVVISHIMSIQAIPFACDQDIIEKVANAESIHEIVVAYRHLLVRRLNVPPWFVEVMDLDLLVSAWGFAIQNLVHPETHEFMGLVGDFGDYDAWDPHPLYYDEEWHSPLTFWGAGPVSLGVWMPLQLFRVDEAAGETWRLDAGMIGGIGCGYIRGQNCFEQVPYGQHGSPIKGALVAGDQVPLVTRLAIRELVAGGAEWELAWKDRR